MARPYERLGRYEEALHYSLGSLEVYEALADRLGHAEAQRHWRDALAIMERLGIPEADDVRALLAG